MTLSRKPFVRPERQPVTPVSNCRGVYSSAKDRGGVGVAKESREMLPGDEARLWAHVRSLPCARCWKEGRTEVSHSNQSIDGKAMSIKSKPWRVAALCHECHALIDQGAQHSKDQRRDEWNAAHRWTLGQLFERHMVRPI